MITAFAWLNPDSDGIWSDRPLSAADSLLRTVLNEHTGAVLVGTQEDRRRVVQTALQQLSVDRPVYQLHGSKFACELPYGSLSILLARLELEPGASWHHTTKVLGQFLAPEDADPAVVILSQPQLMDRDSVTVLAQLAQQQRVTLVVQCDRQLDLPPDFAALARAGALKHIAVRPLTPVAAHELLSEHLGAKVSRMATTVLWRYCAGHAGQLAKVAEDCVRSGKLRLVDGEWVVGDGPMPGGEPSGGHDVLLRRMPARRRALVEVLAAGGPSPVGDLVRAGDGSDLDELQGQGIVQIRPTPEGRVAAVQPIWRDRVLAELEPERRRELDLLMEEQDALLRQRLRLAEELLATSDVAAALHLLGADDGIEDPVRREEGQSSTEEVPTPVHRRLVWATVRAFIAAGDIAGALAAAESVPDADDSCLTILMATVHAARGDLALVEHWLEVGAASHRQDLLDRQDPGRNGEAVRLMVEATRAEALALADDQEAARRAAAWVDDQLSTFHRRGVLDDIMSTYDRAALAVSLLETHLRCGDLQACRDLSEALLRCRHGNPQAVLHAELVVAAVDLLSGQLEQAGDLAARIAVQAEASGDRHATAVAEALTVFCRSAGDRGRSDQASHAAVAVGEGRNESLMWGRLGWFAEVVRSLALSSTRPGEAVPALSALGDRARAQGLSVVELHVLLGAALLGASEVGPRLRHVARSTQCSVSGPAAELAEAALADDPAMFCNALTGLAAAGYTGWCHGGLTPVVARLSPSDARRLAEALAVNPSAAPDGGADTPPGWMQDLTPREREIARMVVDGLSNAMVARRHGISVRTVEGHLYQIYAKLQVRGRCGLTRLAAQSPHPHPVE